MDNVSHYAVPGMTRILQTTIESITHGSHACHTVLEQLCWKIAVLMCFALGKQ